MSREQLLVSGGKVVSPAQEAVRRTKEDLIKPKGVIGSILSTGSKLFSNTAKLVGTATGMAGEGGAALLDKNVREQMLNSTPEDFKRQFPFLGQYVDQKAFDVAKDVTGRAVGTAVEVAPFSKAAPVAAAASQQGPLASKLSEVTAKFPNVMRYLGYAGTGAAYGGSAGLSRSLQEDKDVEDTLKTIGKGAAIGAAISVAVPAVIEGAAMGWKKIYTTLSGVPDEAVDALVRIPKR